MNENRSGYLDDLEERIKSPETPGRQRAACRWLLRMLTEGECRDSETDAMEARRRFAAEEASRAAQNAQGEPGRQRRREKAAQEMLADMARLLKDTEDDN